MRLLLTGIMAAVLVSVFAFTAVRYPDEPPPAHTGGFGEPTCYDCHFDNKLNDGTAIFRIDGLSGPPAPGRSYEVELVLVREGMSAAGFQLAFRTASGDDAGTLEPLDDRSTVSKAGATYLQHTAQGTSLVATDTARWRFRWTADDAPGPVLIHAAGNAGNGDESQFGDYVYTLEKRLNED